MKNKALERLICGLAALLLCFSLSSFKLVSQVKTDTLVNKGYKLRTIVVDAGHGGTHTGTGPRFSHGASGSFSTEREVTLAIAFKLQAAIQKEMDGIKVVLTRTTEDDVDWQKRADIANDNKGDLFISLHCNAMPDRHIKEKVGTKKGKAVYKTVTVPDRSGKGVLVLVYGLHRSGEEENAIKHTQIEAEASEEDASFDPKDPVNAILINEYTKKFRKQSINLANLINSELVDVDGRRSDGVIEQGILVLCHTAMPSVLVETGFIDNPDDEAYLNSDKGQNEVVDSIVRALKKYRDEVEQVTNN